MKDNSGIEQNWGGMPRRETPKVEVKGDERILMQDGTVLDKEGLSPEELKQALDSSYREN